MERSAIKEKIIKMILDFVDEDIDITEDKELMGELDLDSLDIIAMISDIEDAFDISMTYEDNRQVTTVGDIIDCIAKKIG